MGSLSASGIPVVTKTSTTYRKRDKLITSANSVTDVVTNVVDRRESLHRTISSGSIVRDDGSVVYSENRVWGLHLPGNTSDARIPRDETKNLSVDINDNETEAVIETSLQPDTPQTTTSHTGNRVVRSNSANDTLIDRVEGGRGVAPDTP